MIGKDEFGNLRLRERRKGGERLCICRYEVIISLWCEELVTDLIYCHGEQGATKMLHSDQITEKICKINFLNIQVKNVGKKM